MQYIFIRNYALLSRSSHTRMSFVSLITKLESLRNYFLSFDGVTTQLETSSNFPHYRALALGNYRDSPFITGDYTTPSAYLKTEILNYETDTWVEVADYPFSTNRYAKYKCVVISWNMLIKKHLLKIFDDVQLRDNASNCFCLYWHTIRQHTKGFRQ